MRSYKNIEFALSGSSYQLVCSCSRSIGFDLKMGYVYSAIYAGIICLTLVGSNGEYKNELGILLSEEYLAI